MKFNLNSFLMSVSVALDMSEKEIMGIDIYHSRRVAYMSLRIAKTLNLSDEECFDICALAILHDNGITEAVLKNDLISPEDDFVKLENIVEHCVIGEKNIENFPFLTNPNNVILYHHEYFDGSGFFKKKQKQIPILAQIISFADTIDFDFRTENDHLDNRERIKEYVKNNIGIKHSKEISDAFFKLDKERAFWSDQQSLTINSSIMKYLPDISLDLDFKDIFEITKIFSKIIDSKSKFTYAHSSGLIEKAESMARYYKFDNDKVQKFKISASLHDLGKLAIPSHILEKPSPLDEHEFDIIKTHTYYTSYMLCNIDGFKEISQWAYSHHEKLDGSGYPFSLSGDQLSFEARLLSCLDIYQSLTEDRPYRDGMKHTQAMKILASMAKENKIDSNIVNDIGEYFMDAS